MSHQALEKAISYRERVLATVPSVYAALEQAISAKPVVAGAAAVLEDAKSKVAGVAPAALPA